MKRRLDELEAKVESLGREVEALRLRIDRLARDVSDGATEPVAAEPGAETPSRAIPRGEGIPLLALVGRTLMVLAGAYLLRAITDAGFVPPVVGAGLGLIYAASWLVLGDMAAGKGRRWSALFHGFAATIIAFPLLWETTSRFRLFSPMQGAVLLVLMLGGCTVLALRRELAATAWTSTLFALVTCVMLMAGTRDLLPFAFALLIIAALTEWLAFRDRWPGLRWPVALVVNTSLLLVLTVATRDEPPEGYATLGTGAVLTLALALPLLYLATIGARNLGRLLDATPFEIFQSVAALILGFGGAARLLGLEGNGRVVLGALSTALGAGCYAVTFAFVDRRKGHQRNFFFYSSLGGVLVLAGTALLVADRFLGLTWALLGLTIVALGWRFDRFTLRFHGSLYMTAAAASGGVLTAAGYALAGSPETSPPAPPVLAYGVVGATLAGYALLVRGRRDHETRVWARRFPSFVVAAVLCASLAGLLADSLARALAGASPGRDVAVVVSVRTGVLALLAILCGWLGRRSGLWSIAWLCYPLLVLGGISLALQDFRLGRPLTLFISFTLYGAALILAPRIGRPREGREAT